MRSIVFVVSLGLAACSVSHVSGGNPGGARGSGDVGGSGGAGGVGGGEGGAGGTGGEGGGGAGGAGGAGGMGGVGGTGGEGGGCIGDEVVGLFLVPALDGTGSRRVAGRVSEHRGIAAEEVPTGAWGVDRVLAIEPPGNGVPTRLYYKVGDPSLAPQVAVGDVVELHYQLYWPWGRSAGAVLRARGELVWAAEQGSFGPLGTGEADFWLEEDASICEEPWDCGILRTHRVNVNFPGRDPIGVSPGETVTLRLGDREGPFHLAAWVTYHELTCTDMPDGVSHYAWSLPLPERCGPALDRDCPEGQYCEFLGDGCGEDGEVGACAPIPEICVEWSPVCGCDGRVYLGQCLANHAGTDIGRGCEDVEGHFACGPYLCDSFLEYCRVVMGGGTGFPDDHECVPLPEACQAMDVPTCNCLGAEPCGDHCTGAFPGLTLTCPGG